ncbi:AbfB domain-containing protein [Staphylococcus aureus]|uniref:AbfB domain-containing protein n=1 Tax=Staphylococcus aureus TaxID=1280 RepID=UPI00321BFBAF
MSKKWELLEIDKSPNTFAIRNVLSDLCLAGAGEGQSLSQQNCDSVNAAQQWQFLALGKDVTRVRNVANGLFLTNNSVNENNIRPATLESTQFAAKQNWTPAVVGKARYDIAKPNDFISIESASVAGRFINHAGTKGTVGAINSSAPAAARQAASWKIVPGLGNPRCYSFQSMDTPNSYLLGIGPGAVVEVQPTTGKNLGDFTFCAEQAKFGNGAISFYRYTDAFRSLRMYDTKLYQAAYFDAGVPEADNQQWVVNDTAWKISSPLALPTP